MTLTLIRLLSKDSKKEWLLVKEGEREVLRVDWDDNLLRWIDAHKREIDEEGDVNTFLEYYHHWQQQQEKERQRQKS